VRRLAGLSWQSYGPGLAGDGEEATHLTEREAAQRWLDGDDGNDGDVREEEPGPPAPGQAQFSRQCDGLVKEGIFLPASQDEMDRPDLDRIPGTEDVQGLRLRDGPCGWGWYVDDDPGWRLEYGCESMESQGLFLRAVPSTDRAEPLSAGKDTGKDTQMSAGDKSPQANSRGAGEGGVAGKGERQRPDMIHDNEEESLVLRDGPCGWGWYVEERKRPFDPADPWTMRTAMTPIDDLVMWRMTHLPPEAEPEGGSTGAAASPPQQEAAGEIVDSGSRVGEATMQAHMHGGGQPQAYKHGKGLQRKKTGKLMGYQLSPLGPAVVEKFFRSILGCVELGSGFSSEAPRRCPRAPPPEAGACSRELTVQSPQKT